MDTLYHLTGLDNLDQILTEGLRAGDDGWIYLFTDMLVANTIARDQVFLGRYAVIEVDRRGITGRLHRDNVGEFSAPYHRRVKTRRIAAKHLRHVGTFDVVADYPTEWDYLVWGRMGMTRDDVDLQYRVRRAPADGTLVLPPGGLSYEEARRQLDGGAVRS